MKIAAIQLNAVFADVKSNLIMSENYIRRAAICNANLVILPEFFTTAIGYSDMMLDAVMQNKHIKDIMKQWSSKYRIIIGGSYIAFDKNDAFNIYTLVFPDGSSYEHKKDIPTQFENCYYTDGDINNVLHTPIGNIGIAMCWEMIRYDTIKRLTSNVDLILSGSCWWDLPDNASAESEPLRRYNQNLALQTPVTFAKLLGVPVVHANHCGKITAYRFPAFNQLQTRQLVGAAQIIDESGNIIARRCFFDGDGIISSELTWDTSIRKNTSAIPSKYWIPDLPDSYIAAWEQMNPIGKQYYNNTALPYYRNHDKNMEIPNDV